MTSVDGPEGKDLGGPTILERRSKKGVSRVGVT